MIIVITLRQAVIIMVPGVQARRAPGDASALTQVWYIH